MISLSLFTLFALLLLLHTAAHVVFEEIGQMAGATSYIHLTIPVGLNVLEEQISDFIECVNTYRNEVNESLARQIEKLPKDLQHWERVSKVNTLQQQHMRNFNLSAAFILQGEDLQRKVAHLRGVLPAPATTPDAQTRTSGSSVSRKKRGLMKQFTTQGSNFLRSKGTKQILGTAFKVAKHGLIRSLGSPSIIFSLAKGILGTFMGLYTQNQIDKLREDVDELREGHNQLVEVVAKNQVVLEDLIEEVNFLRLRLDSQEILQISYVMATLNGMYFRLKDSLEVAVHTIQQAQHRRLAIDFLSPDTLRMLFEDLTSIAQEKGFFPLTNQPSDLLQIETSYTFDGNDVLLLLHVPMTPKDSLLRLFRLRPFPIPISDTLSILPKAPTSILALSKGKNRLMTTIEHSDLLGCHQIGNVYTCDRHGALRRDVKSHCLGALFEQDIPRARQLCDLELVPRQEAVTQLQSNWFLVYSPTMFTAYVTCQNGTSSEEYIRREIRRVHVSPGCSLELKNHTLTSEFSLYLDESIKYVPWEKEDLSLFGLKSDEVAESLTQTTGTERGVSLAEVIKISKAKRKPPHSGWPITFFILIGISALIGLVILILSTVGAQRFLMVRNKLRSLKASLSSLLPDLASHLNRVLSHLNLPRMPIPHFLYPNLPVELGLAQAPPPPFEQNEF